MSAAKVAASRAGGSAAPSVPPEFLAVFRAHAQARARPGDRPGAAAPPSDAAAVMTFAEFMALALYDERVGYYRRGQPRVGRGAGTDFYTASSSGTVFGELVVAACVQLLGGAAEAARFTWVEIGAEPSAEAKTGRVGGVLAGLAHPFAGARTIGLSEPLTLGGASVVFSNELFDAQPLRRFRRCGGAWRELGVALDGDILSEVELGEVSEPWLPAAAPEGYIFDAPRAAVALADVMAAQPWHGLFVAFDYGKPWAELATMTPAGTARTYHRHRQSNDLLARPGAQDLTGHVCWDWLAEALAARGLADAVLESQEAFFVRHAAGWLEQALAGGASASGARRRAIAHLLHPAQMGQKFQVLHARRLPAGAVPRVV
ncbi:MAG: SAM-dependent methyltransferase [Verrucomicrobiota bacterium]